VTRPRRSRAPRRRHRDAVRCDVDSLTRFRSRAFGGADAGRAGVSAATPRALHCNAGAIARAEHHPRTTTRSTHMAPIIPTHRPIVTPERTAVGIAVVAVLCSVFLIADAAYGGARDHAQSGALVLTCDARPLAEPGDGKPTHF
jgi:hypothetical protein